MSIRKRCIIKVLSVRTGAIMTSLQCHCNSQEPLNAKSEVKSNKGRSFFHIESCIPLRHTEQSSLSRHWILLPWGRVGEVVETSWSYRLSLCWQCLYKVYDEHGRVSPVTGAWALVSRGMSVDRCQWCDGPAPSHRGDRSSASGSVSPALTQHSPENGQILHRVDNSGIDNRVKALIIVSYLCVYELRSNNLCCNCFCRILFLFQIKNTEWGQLYWTSLYIHENHWYIKE